MAVYEGELSELGSAVVTATSAGQGSTFNYITIGSKRLENVVADGLTADFLRLGEIIKISVFRFMRKNVIVLLKRPDGEVIRNKLIVGALIGNHVGMALFFLIPAGVITGLASGFTGGVGNLGVFFAAWAVLFFVFPIRAQMRLNKALAERL